MSLLLVMSCIALVAGGFNLGFLVGQKLNKKEQHD